MARFRSHYQQKLQIAVSRRSFLGVQFEWLQQEPETENFMNDQPMLRCSFDRVLVAS